MAKGLPHMQQIQRYCSRQASTMAVDQAKVSRFTLTRKSQGSPFPLHFSATGVHCGIKKDPSNLDLALVVSSSPYPTASAACFTKNAFQAAPVQVSKAILAKSQYARALIVNSGCANAVTGQKGLEDAWAMSRTVDEALKSAAASNTTAGTDHANTFVMSTGVIGQHLPIHRILPAIKASCLPTLSSSFESWDAAARAFMTTDTFPKLRTKTFEVPGIGQARFVGIDKGAGMIHPRMGPPGPPHATLLSMVATDATVSPKALQSALTYAVDRSFNSISVDGDTSTNDTIIAMANGAAWQGKHMIEEDGPGYIAFRDALTSFLTELATLIVWDGEGATKFVTVAVEECPSYKIAHRIASTISTSTILKCAYNGADANWGRVLCAVGYSEVDDFVVDPTSVSVSFESGSDVLHLLRHGEPVTPVDEVLAKKMLSRDEFLVRVKMGQGDSSAA